MDLNIHITAHAYAHAGLFGPFSVPFSPDQTFSSKSSTTTSRALFSGPESRFNALLHWANFLSNNSSHL